MRRMSPELSVPDLASDSPGQDPCSLRDSGCSPAGMGPETRNGRPHCRSRESGLSGSLPAEGAQVRAATSRFSPSLNSLLARPAFRAPSAGHRGHGRSSASPAAKSAGF